MARKLTRKEMREQLYRMLFQLEFHKDAELDEQLALFMDDLQEIREADRIELADKFHGVAAHVEELDSMINDKSTGWKVGRLPKADLTVLRLAVYEKDLFLLLINRIFCQLYFYRYVLRIGFQVIYCQIRMNIFGIDRHQ